MEGRKPSRRADIFIGLLLFIGGIFSLFTIVYADKILPGVRIGIVDVGGLTREEASGKLKSLFHILEKRGIHIVIGENREIINPKNIDTDIPFDELAQEALSIGRAGGVAEKAKAWVLLPFSKHIIEGRTHINEEKLEAEIEILADVVDAPRRDIRFNINADVVEILYDTKVGKVLNKLEAKTVIMSRIKNMDFRDIIFEFEDDLPMVNSLYIENARKEAGSMISDSIVLVYKGWTFSVERERIGSWIVSDYAGDRLVPGINKKLISEYITEIAEYIDTAPQSPRVVVREGKAIEFTLPKSGRVLLQDETIGLIESILEDRRLQREATSAISLPVLIKKPQGTDGSSKELGIVERIGGATTPFTGSPSNRVHNIKNGIKFLSGILVPPGEEFSTVGSLGKIDNTTGYLPELVIKGDETIPEFGGGLCQVSTTLFRAVLDAGLPVLERRNHSYRVPYYERDGDGNYIGPGLDATIYSPKPDFKFKNDTEASILIYGFVAGDKATFELYGTRDGRVSEIDGPHTLSVIPPGDPIYTETDTLPKGEKKKIDSAHPGGEAVATYRVEYPDGSINEQEFKSFYRKWPAKYLVGIKE